MLGSIVWKCEFKNIHNTGRVWIKFKNEERRFGMPLKQKRTYKIIPGDLIQVASEMYIVNKVGVKKVNLTD
jgi:hypothetical protein